MPRITDTLRFNSTGEIQGSATAAVLPTLKGLKYVVLRALSSNAGNVYLGASTVTVPDGTTDVTTGFELAAGDSEGFYIGNLAELYRICDNAGDDLVYIAYS